MGRIIIFLRVSTTGQQLESQEDSLRRAAIADGYSEDDFIIIGKKESAIKLSEEEREGLNQLKKVIESEEVDCIYISELSRLSRRPHILYSLRELLLQRKIQLKCQNPLFTLLSDDRTKYDATANIVFSLFGALAEQEMLEKKARFSRGKKRKADEGKFSGGAIPFGYVVDYEKDKLIVIHEEDAQLVKLIFNLYEEGYSQPKLVTELRKRGHIKVTLSFVNNILNNRSYTGELLKKKGASYERRYPPIISVSQFERCRQLAKNNNVNISKAKNIYYAEKLVKCPSCQTFWSATGHQTSYACPCASRANTTWLRENHNKEKCKNKTSISINILDSVLWNVAREREVDFILSATNQSINDRKKEAANVKSKLDNIQPRLSAIQAKINRLREMYIDGMSKEAYDNKRAQLNSKIIDIKQEETILQDEYYRLQEIIEELQHNSDLKITATTDDNNYFHYYNPWPEYRSKLSPKIYMITNDDERKKIIKRHVQSVEVIPTVIRFPFRSITKDCKARKILIHCYPLAGVPYEHHLFEFFTLPNDGHGQPIIIDISPTVWSDGWPTFYSYLDDINYPLNDISGIYEQRFSDTHKKERRKREKEIKAQRIGNRISLSEASKQLGISYWHLYNMVRKGNIDSEMVGGKYYVDIEQLTTLDN